MMALLRVALLLRTVALGRDALPTLEAAARSLESEALVVTAEPLSAESSPLLQSLSSSSRTLLVLFGAAVLGAVVSLFGALGVLTRTLAPTWRIATMVGNATSETLQQKHGQLTKNSLCDFLAPQKVESSSML